MARIGKIARLPKEIRDELNRRLNNGERQDKLVDWLNGLEPVKAVLKSQFGGRPISEQNMSDWRKGGYAEWEQSQEVVAFARDIRDKPDAFLQGLDGKLASECFSTLLAVNLVELSKTLLDEKMNMNERWRRVCQVHEQLSRLRRDDHRRTMRRLMF